MKGVSGIAAAVALGLAGAPTLFGVDLAVERDRTGYWPMPRKKKAKPRTKRQRKRLAQRRARRIERLHRK